MTPSLSCDGASRSLSDSSGPSHASEGLPAAPHSCTFSGQVAKTSHPRSPARGPAAGLGFGAEHGWEGEDQDCPRAKERTGTTLAGAR